MSKPGTARADGPEARHLYVVGEAVMTKPTLEKYLLAGETNHSYTVRTGWGVAVLKKGTRGRTYLTDLDSAVAAYARAWDSYRRLGDDIVRAADEALGVIADTPDVDALARHEALTHLVTNRVPKGMRGAK